MLDQVKLYGERNSGTNVLHYAINLNFACEVLTGNAHISEERIEHSLDQLGLAGLERAQFREHVLDDAIFRDLDSNLGWKHGVPPYSVIRAYPRLAGTLFLVITKDPYNWLLSFHQRPYHKLYSQELDFSGFIRHYWITVRRENLPLALLENPVQLYSLKLEGYQQLSKLASHFLHIRYSDFLNDFEGTMNALARFLPHKQATWTLPLDSLKREALDFYDYQRKYADPDRLKAISAEDRAYINAYLDSALLSRWGYELLSNQTGT